jgi:transcriptional regulator with XRE-family HTH domain
MIGHQLAALRRRASLSQSALAVASGVNQGVISRIERGDIKEPRFTTMVKLSEAMGVSLDAFVTRGKRTTEKQ